MSQITQSIRPQNSRHLRCLEKIKVLPQNKNIYYQNEPGAYRLNQPIHNGHVQSMGMSMQTNSQFKGLFRLL